MPWLHLFLPFLFSLGCFSCMTAYLIFFCMDSHYDKTLKKVARYIAEQNEQVYLPRGLMLTDPIERGLRCIEIAIFNEPTQVQTWFPLLSSLHASFIFFPSISTARVWMNTVFKIEPMSHSLRIPMDSPSLSFVIFFSPRFLRFHFLSYVLFCRMYKLPPFTICPGAFFCLPHPQH